MIYGDKPDKDNPVISIEAIIQSGNLFVYCMGNPVMFVDPLGKSSIGDNILDEEDQLLIKVYTYIYEEAEKRGDRYTMDIVHYLAVKVRQQAKYTGKHILCDENGIYNDEYNYIYDISKQSFIATVNLVHIENNLQAFLSSAVDYAAIGTVIGQLATSPIIQGISTMISGLPVGDSNVKKGDTIIEVKLYAYTNTIYYLRFNENGTNIFCNTVRNVGPRR